MHESLHIFLGVLSRFLRNDFLCSLNCLWAHVIEPEDKTLDFDETILSFINIIERLEDNVNNNQSTKFTCYKNLLKKTCLKAIINTNCTNFHSKELKIINCPQSLFIISSTYLVLMYFNAYFCSRNHLHIEQVTEPIG